MKIDSELTAKIVVFVLAALGCYYIFGKTFFYPNDYMFAFGGDPYLIYYNVVYHATHGHGYYMSNMAYPLVENPFMSGGEACWALLLVAFKNMGLDMSAYSIGLIHLTKYLSIWAACHFMYLSMRLLEVNRWMSVVFSILIVFLNPIMLRMFSHYGLAYPHMIPLAMWWILYRIKYNSLSYKDGLVFFTLVFFTLNNPYVGFSATAFGLLCAALLFFYYRKTDKRKTMLYVGGLFIASAVVVFGLLKFTDPFSDRVEVQWGFFHYFSSPAGFIAPEGSFMNMVLNQIGIPVIANEFERKIYLGTAVILIYFGVLVYLLQGLVKRQKLSTNIPVFFKAALIASVLLFIYTANKKLIPMNEDWIEEHLGPLLMFKAVARLAWSVYFVLAIFAVYILNKWKSALGPTLGFPVVAIVVLIWMADIASYVKPNFKNIANANFWSKIEEDNFEAEMKAANIDFDKYQAMLTIPKLELWSDKFISDLHWSSQFHSFRISVFTGLPLVNAMLSRAAVGVSKSSIQLFSDAVIEKERPKIFPNNKPLLIVLGDEYPILDRGEASLLSHAKIVYDGNGYTLFELPISALNNAEAVKQANGFRKAEMAKGPVFHEGFDDIGSAIDTFFYASPALKVEKGMTKVFNEILPTGQDCQLKFSVWTHVDNHKYGIGDWAVQTVDSIGQIVNHVAASTRKSYQIQGDWVRTEIIIDYHPGLILEAYIIANQSFVIDDIIIDYSLADSYFLAEGRDTFLFNGYKVKIQ